MNIELILLILTGMVTIASIITDYTETPAEGSRWWRAYKVLETLAFLNHKAKQVR